MKGFASIIMDIREIGESDLLVTFFTREKGKLKGIAKGAKRSKKRFFNCLDLFCLVLMEMEKRKNRDISFLHSCKLIQPFNRIREDYRAFVLASYMIELADILFPVGVPDESMFCILESSLNMLQEKQNYEFILTNYEAKAMFIGGYGINLDRCQNCGRAYQGKGNGVFLAYKGGIICLNCIKNVRPLLTLEPDTINTLKTLQSPFSSLDDIQVDYKIISRIRKVLNLHITYILGSKLKSKRFIDALFPLSRVPSGS